MLPNACPKPKPTPKRAPTGLRRGGRLQARADGSAFPKRRDRDYRRWIRDQPCLLAGKVLARAISPNDVPLGLAVFGVRHRCWGPRDPAHVGQHQATGAPDFGQIVPLCRAAHDWYDQHRPSWVKITGYTAAVMESAASGLALKYVERGGEPGTSRKEVR